MQATNSFLCNDGQTWVKKLNEIFDITMGGFHGAMVCDLIGLYLLSQLEEVIPDTGLYRDDGLSVSRATNRQIELMKIVKFLDVTLDLSSGSYKPYMKEHYSPVYANCGSNHPPVVLKNI